MVNNEKGIMILKMQTNNHWQNSPMMYTYNVLLPSIIGGKETGESKNWGVKLMLQILYLAQTR